MEPIENIHNDWTGQGGQRDRERAIALATDHFEGVLYERRVPVLEEMRVASEPLLDGVEWGPGLVAAAYFASEPVFRSQELRPGADDVAGIEVRHGPSIELSRALYRDGREREALVRAYAVLRQLGELVGGPSRLHDLLASPNPSAVAKTAVAALGIFFPTLREGLSQLGPRPRAHLPMIGKQHVTAYLSAPRGPVVYPRTHALATQAMNYFIFRGDPRDYELIQALYELDKKTRPDHARARATTGLRELAYARFLDRPRDVEKYQFEARQALEAFGLERHIRLHGARGELAA